MDLRAAALKAAAAALALAAGAAGAQAPPDPVQAGRRIYTSYCARCHGINLVVTSSAFFDLRTFPRDDKGRFVRSVREGKRAMPAWGDQLKPEDIDAVWTYVGSVNGWGEAATASK